MVDNKKRLVYADMLVEKARQFEELDGDGIPCDVMAVSVTAIENAPTVDAVEVVMCCECRFNEPFLACNGSYPNRCMHWPQFYHTVCLPDDFFCKFGERRSNDGNP